MFENLVAPTAFMKPFPPFEDVFGDPAHLHRKHFLPLLSVDVSVVHPDLRIWLHFVTPIEPLLELDVGYFTQEHHDFYNQEGQYAFHVRDGRYAFSGDFNYFAYESGAIFQAFPGKEAEIHEDYRVRFASYETNRRRYLEHRRIPSSAYCPYEPKSDRCGPLVTQFGGEPVLGN